MSLASLGVCSLAGLKKACGTNRPKVDSSHFPPMHVFYIPDGHRRFAELRGRELSDAYALGIEVLWTEVVNPLLSNTPVSSIDVFCLSNQNMRRRDRSELQTFLARGEEMLEPFISLCTSIARVETLGDYLKKNVVLNPDAPKTLRLLIGSGIDDVEVSTADIFIRSGGELRLSGAPRALIGNYTQFYCIDELHPEVKFASFEAILSRYQNRYVRATDNTEPGCDDGETPFQACREDDS